MKDHERKILRNISRQIKKEGEYNTGRPTWRTIIILKKIRCDKKEMSIFTDISDFLAHILEEQKNHDTGV